MRTFPLFPFLDPVRDPLTHQYRGGVGVGAGDLGEDGAVGDSEVIHATDPAVLVGYGHEVGVGAHASGAGVVAGGAYGAEQVGVQLLVVSKFFLGGVYPLADDFLVGGVVDHPADEAQPLP